jgi:hypothetical protein
MNEPTIVAAEVAAGHDGLAEIAVVVRYPNGAVRDICFPHDAIGPVLDAGGIRSLDQLIGQPWTILIAPNGHDNHHDHLDTHGA